MKNVTINSNELLSLSINPLVKPVVTVTLQISDDIVFYTKTNYSVKGW